ncbi:ARM repeat-containing protein [Atractiella rhizophila]|nr:ARM repeat-containing protein [Atractiella rhizophila]
MSASEQDQPETVEDMEEEEQTVSKFDRSTLHRAKDFWGAFDKFIDDARWKENVFWATGTGTKPFYMLCYILDVYQSEPYLLDPYLDRIVQPVVEKFRVDLKAVMKRWEEEHDPSYNHGAEEVVNALKSERMEIIAKFIYWMCKVRGEKYIVHYFPHSVSDLSLLLRLFSLIPTPDSVIWQINYDLLLWLSLVVTLPFSLSSFDTLPLPSSSPTTTVERIEYVAFTHLHRSSKDRDAAVRLLSSLYSRSEGQLGGRLSNFLDVIRGEICAEEGGGRWNVTEEGILQTLAAILRAIPRKTVLPMLGDISAFAFLIQGNDEEKKVIGRSILTRKYWIKVIGRVAVLYLPFRAYGRGKVRGKAVKAAFSAEGESVAEGHDEEEDEFDIPEEVENIIQHLLEGLEDKDTVVRYSSAKYIARVASRVPASFSSQLLEAVLSLFEKNVAFDEDGEYDPFTVPDNTWHGACLAVAELVRQGQVGDEALGEVLKWIARAMVFDYLRSSQPVGSSVRDSASYVLWSLARSSARFSTHQVLLIAHTLTKVALFDKEVHVRRAASAAFQEAAGRVGSLPEGINVVQKMDGLAVGLRRKSFLQAAIEVAAFDEYRENLENHLIKRTLAHYDPEMRELGGKALASLLKLDKLGRVDTVARLLMERLKEKEANKIHGALWALSELAAICHDFGSPPYLAIRVQIFKSLSDIPSPILNAYSSASILIACCAVIENAYSMESEMEKTNWWAVINVCLRNGDEACHLAAAQALGNISKFHDCGQEIDSLLQEMGRSLAVAQQGAALVLGRIDYLGPCHKYYEKVLHAMIPFIQADSPKKAARIEGRRNGFEALHLISTSLVSVPGRRTNNIGMVAVPLFLEGLKDYTSDRRGDVGSWVRSACLEGLRVLVPLMLKSEQSLQQDMLDTIVGNVLKHTLEKIDTVRIVARGTIIALIKAVDAESRSCLHRRDLFQPILDQDVAEWRDLGKVFELLLPILAVQEYRGVFLEGVVLGLGSRMETSIGGAATAFVDFASVLEVEPMADVYSLKDLCEDLFQLAKSKYSQHRIFIPTAQAVGLLLEAELLEPLADTETGAPILHRIAEMMVKSTTSKNVQRILVCVKNVLSSFNIDVLRPKVLKAIPDFLCNDIPRVRTAAADDLYLILQTRGEATEAVQEILLGTAWLNASQDELKSKVDDLIAELSQGN